MDSGLKTYQEEEYPGKDHVDIGCFSFEKVLELKNSSVSTTPLPIYITPSHTSTYIPTPLQQLQCFTPPSSDSDHESIPTPYINPSHFYDDFSREDSPPYWPTDYSATYPDDDDEGANYDEPTVYADVDIEANPHLAHRCSYCDIYGHSRIPNEVPRPRVRPSTPLGVDRMTPPSPDRELPTTPYADPMPNGNDALEDTDYGLCSPPFEPVSYVSSYMDDDYYESQHDDCDQGRYDEHYEDHSQGRYNELHEDHNQDHYGEHYEDHCNRGQYEDYQYNDNQYVEYQYHNDRFKDGQYEDDQVTFDAWVDRETNPQADKCTDHDIRDNSPIPDDEPQRTLMVMEDCDDPMEVPSRALDVERLAHLGSGNNIDQPPTAYISPWSSEEEPMHQDLDDSFGEFSKYFRDDSPPYFPKGYGSYSDDEPDDDNNDDNDDDRRADQLPVYTMADIEANPHLAHRCSYCDIHDHSPIPYHGLGPDQETTEECDCDECVEL
ncbi:hypothetical protein BG011_010150 [Mortierella polycephala]|uniref:Uncharacterized protein n=1 Tax=Mortierella polycephala TaxID=41804 RepID=A0A9P6U6C1_9FUNG|nr:hypothetical protein BG011_010150 [Mortierella polycephala]